MALAAKTVADLTEFARPKVQIRVKRVKARKPGLPEAVNDFAAQHGDYERDGLRGQRNRGGTPIARWRTADLLDDRQWTAIEYCIRLWERAARDTGLVMDLTKIIGLPPSSGWSQQEALDELASFKNQIPAIYWEVFENVCRWDEPAGVAGSRLATNKRSAIDRAQLCVRFVADLIATWKRF